MFLETKASSVAGYEKGTYYLITVRLWLEGEDTTCNNTTFANLEDDWRLDMAWSLEDTEITESVTSINATSTNAKVDLSGAAVSSGSTIEVSGHTYYELDIEFATGVKAYIDSDTYSSSSRVFTYDGTHLTEVTNQCILKSN